MKIQGQYPVVFITFKNQKHINYQEFVDGITLMIFNLYREYDYLLVSDKLTELDKENYNHKKFINSSP